MPSPEIAKDNDTKGRMIEKAAKVTKVDFLKVENRPENSRKLENKYPVIGVPAKEIG
jgi:hypothetical protein